MIRRLIKMRRISGFSLTEVLVTSSIILLLFASIVAASVMVRDVCFTGLADLELQRSLKNVMDHIVIRGPGETVNNGLRSAFSYNIPATGLTVPSATPGTELWFSDDSSNPKKRRYYLQDRSIMYRSDTISQPVTRTVYTAPADATLSLLFLWTAPDNQTVRVFISVDRVMNNKHVSGNLSTFVSLHNIPK